jgi:hypothetical protein
VATPTTGNQREIPVPDVDLLLADGWTHVRLYRAASYTGTASLLTSIALVAGQTLYTYDDDTGSATDWYEHCYFKTAGSVESTRSERTPVEGGPAIQFTMPGVSGVTSSGGTTSTVVASAYINSAVIDNPWLRWFLRFISGTGVAGQERLVSGFDAATGTFTVTPLFTAATPSGGTFELWAQEGGEWWRYQARRQLAGEVWVPFDWPLATPAITGQRIFPLPHWIEGAEQIQSFQRRVGKGPADYRYEPVTAVDFGERDGGGVEARFWSPPPGGDVYVLRGRRHPPAPQSDSSVYLMSEQVVELVTTAIAAGAARALARRAGGASQSEAWAKVATDLEREWKGRARDLGLFPESGRTKTSRIVSIGGHWQGAVYPHRPYGTG